jgi:glutathione S-transferase
MTMKIYGGALSPYCAKVMIQIAAKGLDLPMMDPPGGMGSDEFKALTPTGKVPALEVDGTVIPESTAIMVYLENTQTGPSLFPQDHLESAKVIAISQIADLYVGENLGALFGQMNPKDRSEDIAKSRFEGLSKGIERLETTLEAGPYAHGGQLSFADCTLAPLLFYVTRVIPMLGLGDPMAGAPKVQAYWEAIQKDAHVAGVLEEMGQALAARQAG